MSNLSPLFTFDSYADAVRKCEARGIKPGREVKLCYKTTMALVATRGVAVWHHTTPIVVHYADGTFEIDGDGWCSRTTMNRIGKFTPFGVSAYSKGNTPYVRDTAGAVKEWYGHRVIFNADGTFKEVGK